MRSFKVGGGFGVHGLVAQTLSLGLCQDVRGKSCNNSRAPHPKKV